MSAAAHGLRADPTTADESRASIRRQIRASLVGSGTPPAVADQSLDLAFHAAEEALRTVWSVAERADNSAWANAYSLGLQVAVILLENRLLNFQQSCANHGVASSTTQVMV